MLLENTVGRFTVSTLPCVSILEVNVPMIGACYAYQRLCERHGVHGVMTGAAREEVYKDDLLHRKGFAWDFRSSIFPDPEAAAEELSMALSFIDPLYRVVYIKPPKPAHFHVEWRGGL